MGNLIVSGFLVKNKVEFKWNTKTISTLGKIHDFHTHVFGGSAFSRIFRENMSFWPKTRFCMPLNFKIFQKKNKYGAMAYAIDFFMLGRKCPLPCRSLKTRIFHLWFRSLCPHNHIVSEAFPFTVLAAEDNMPGGVFNYRFGQEVQISQNFKSAGIEVLAYYLTNTTYNGGLQLSLLQTYFLFFVFCESSTNIPINFKMPTQFIAQITNVTHFRGYFVYCFL